MIACVSAPDVDAELGQHASLPHARTACWIHPPFALAESAHRPRRPADNSHRFVQMTMTPQPRSYIIGPP
jgi:hypothetical protein